MTSRALRRTWFAGLWLLFPWPFILFGDALVPAARYAILASAAGAVALAEGAAGPVGPVVGVLIGWTLGTTLACWALAWAAARLLSRLPERAATRVTLVTFAFALAGALVLEPYRTPFGRSLTGGLLEILS